MKAQECRALFAELGVLGEVLCAAWVAAPSDRDRMRGQRMKLAHRATLCLPFPFIAALVDARVQGRAAIAVN